MLFGLLMTSISTVLLPAALFQRKSRSGWLEELDGIREQALETPDGDLTNMVETSDIWTDLREGGEYDNPHEIASLYADDNTPDQPVRKPAKNDKPARRARKPKVEAEAGDGAEAAAGAPVPMPEAPMVAPAASQAPMAEPPMAQPPMAQPPMAPAPTSAPPTEPLAPAAAGGVNSDQIWVQPAPHPIRPSEMWHPAELGAPQLGAETQPAPAEERIASAELGEGSSTAASIFARPRLDHDEPYRSPFHADVPVHDEPAPRVEAMGSVGADAHAADPMAELASQLESELIAHADQAVIESPAPATADQGLVGAPVGRRVRRDRPTTPTRATLPTTVAPSGPMADGYDHPVPGDMSPSIDRGEQSPLPTQPLPPAALPTRANRLPSIETLPTTPSSVVAPQTVGPFDQPPAPAVLEPSAPAAEVVAPPPDVEAFNPDELIIEPPGSELDHELVIESTPDPAPEPVADATPIATGEPAPTAAAASEPVVTPAPAPTAEAASEPEPEPVVVPEPAAAPAPEPAKTSLAEPKPATALTIAADGMVDVPGTIVRIGGDKLASATIAGSEATVVLRAGWCWISPGDGAATPVRVALPGSALRVDPGATALAVADVDGSAFVIVAMGSAELSGTGHSGRLDRGTLAMVDPTGRVQLDRATDAEIEDDPIVAENLSLDAEL